MKTMHSDLIKQLKQNQPHARIIGCDEVGLGALAGPITVGAVASPIILPKWWSEIKDSKSLSETKREVLFAKIVDSDIPWATYDVSNTIIDKLGYTASIKLAFKQVLIKIRKEFSLSSDIFVIIDGSQPMDIGYPIVKADKFIKEVSAASIVAKVIRDRQMIEYDKIYSGYGFSANKGYGTDQHMKALVNYGISDIHRRSVKPIQRILDESM